MGLRDTYDDGVFAANERRSFLCTQRSIGDDASYVYSIVSRRLAEGSRGCGVVRASSLTDRSRCGKGSGLPERELNTRKGKRQHCQSMAERHNAALQRKTLQNIPPLSRGWKHQNRPHGGCHCAWLPARQNSACAQQPGQERRAKKRTAAGLEARLLNAMEEAIVSE